MKYGIDKGHNANYNKGARGIRQEDELTMEVGNKVIAKLRALGHIVIDTTPSYASSRGDALQRRVLAANQSNIDFFVSIHFNAGGGSGTEVFAASEQGRKVAQRVVSEITALGYRNRGVKDGSWLYVLKNTRAPGILIECAFVDSQEDMNRYDGEKMSEAIVRGLTGQDYDNVSGNQTDKENTPKTDKVKGISTEVLELQKILNRFKITDNTGRALVEDGMNGAKTMSAVEKLQGILGLGQDGVAGPKTWGAINEVLKKPLLKIGNSSSTATRYVQWRVGVAIDGIFGSETRDAVISFQFKNTLDADGIVGSKTWARLIG